MSDETNDNAMRDNATPDVSQLGWVPFSDLRQAAHHAHAAWLHCGTRAVLMLIWLGSGTEAGNGRWEWEVRFGRYCERFVPTLMLPDLIEATAWAYRAVERLKALDGSAKSKGV